MVGVETIIDDCNQYVGAIVIIPRRGNIDILARCSAALTGITEMLLVAEFCVVGNQSLAMFKFDHRVKCFNLIIPQ